MRFLSLGRIQEALVNIVLIVTGAAILLLVLLVAYKIGKILLRLCVGLAALALLSWWLWNLFHS